MVMGKRLEVGGEEFMIAGAIERKIAINNSSTQLRQDLFSEEPNYAIRA